MQDRGAALASHEFTDKAGNGEGECDCEQAAGLRPMRAALDIGNEDATSHDKQIVAREGAGDHHEPATNNAGGSDNGAVMKAVFVRLPSGG